MRSCLALLSCRLLSSSSAIAPETTIAMSVNIPETMRAVQATDYGSIDNLSVQDGVRVPRLSDLPPKKQKTSMVIQTHAVSLAPGDVRVLSGLTKEFQGPPAFPYVPGGDCAGVVVELPEDENVRKSLPFTIGDRVAARFADGPRGALGEYALVSTSVADKIPDNVTFDEAAALVSASPATVLANRIQKGERVLVLGANGGVGSHFCQQLRRRGASYVVGVSKTPSKLLEAPISIDEAVDYTKEDVFDAERFQSEPFDTLVDLAGGGYRSLEDRLKQGKTPLIVKPASQGGRCLTLVLMHGPEFEIHTFWQMLHIFMFPQRWRAITSRTWNRWKLPKFTFAMSLPGTRDCVTQTFDEVTKGKLKAVIAGPFKFTTGGVRDAFRLQKSRHPNGKVVVHVADEVRK